MELKLIDCEEIQKTKPNYYEIYKRSFSNSVKKMLTTKDTKSYVKPIVFWGIKMFNEDPELKDIEKLTHENIQTIYIMMDSIKTGMSQLTPNEVINLFPIIKKYNGKKSSSKDYFSTIEAIEKMELDTPIGDNIEEFLWDYYNRDIMRFDIRRLRIISHLYERETGKGIMEEFMRQNNVPVYKLTKDKKTGKQFLVDDKGNKTKVTKPIPRYLKPL